MGTMGRVVLGAVVVVGALTTVASCGPSLSFCDHGEACPPSLMCDVPTGLCVLPDAPDGGTGGGLPETGGGAGGGSRGGGGGGGGELPDASTRDCAPPATRPCDGGCANLQTCTSDGLWGSCQPACGAGLACVGDACTCTTTSCPGCCHANTCLSGNDPQACGSGGVECSACPATQSCDAGACSGCNPSSCASGCCSGPTCKPKAPASCGLLGQACTTCDPLLADACDATGKCACGSGAACNEGQRCLNHQCVCDGESCPAGCCAGTPGTNVACKPFASQGNTTCGTGGVQCASCTPTGERCNARGVCICDTTSCAAGCCAGAPGTNVACVPYASQGLTACGTGGATCGGCSAGQHCSSAGVCTCDGTSCPNGCCTSSTGTCVTYANQGLMACGTGGATCGSCSSDQHCSSAGVCTCDNSTCPNGCCTSTTGSCVPYANQGDSTCGNAGATCGGCPSGQHCGGNGTCICDGTSCPNGCCTSPTGTCVPYAAQGSATCGTAGARCRDCTPTGEACNGSGLCVCDGTSCASGCCSGQTGTDVPCLPSLDAQCGLGGQTCRNCTTTGERCTAGLCLCDSTSCPRGCCAGTSGTDVACTSGTTDAQCGTNGEACFNASLSCNSNCFCNANLKCLCHPGGGQCVGQAVHCPTPVCAGGC
jgi:hypothetical protein